MLSRNTTMSQRDCFTIHTTHSLKHAKLEAEVVRRVPPDVDQRKLYSLPE